MYDSVASCEMQPEPDDWVQVLEDESTLLKDLQPPELAIYKQYFIDYAPKKTFHVKYDYRGGFLQRKRKGSGVSLPLFPALLDQALERHLDPQRYYDHHRLRDPNKTPPRGPYWLALHAPRATSLECADLDNRSDQGKNVIGYYSSDGITRPVVRCPLEFVQKLHRFWSHFPGRIWCVSSETLGIHAWKKLPARRPLQLLHDIRRDQLAQIGLAYETEVEIYPHPSRCHRRPFGLDYRTITNDGIITDWREQVRYFDQFAGDSPSFDAIVQAILDAQAVQQRNWLRHSVGAKKLVSVLGELEVEASEVRAWLASKPVCEHPPDEKRGVILTIHARGQARRAWTPPAGAGGVNILPPPGIWKTGQWVQTIQNWVVNGLPGPNTIRTVTQELAEWLVWVEFYDHHDRQGHVAQLLWQFILNKHNGHVSRMDNRIWQELRQKRASGQYQEVIYLAPYLAAGKGEPQVSSLRPIYSVSTLPLPEEAAGKGEPQVSSLRVLSGGRGGRRNRGAGYRTVTG